MNAKQTHVAISPYSPTFHLSGDMEDWPPDDTEICPPLTPEASTHNAALSAFLF